MSVIEGATANAVQFVTVPPCRVVDTRNSGGPIQGGTFRNFNVPSLGGCNIPGSAAAFSLNVTVVPQSTLGYLTVWPTGEDQPAVSTLNSPDGRVKANATIIPAGYQGDVSVYVTDTTNVILDIFHHIAAAIVGPIVFTLGGCTLQEQPSTTGIASPTVSTSSANSTVEPQGCVGDVAEVLYSATVESAAHKVARGKKDTAQQRCDEILLEMKQELAKCRTIAATTAEYDADQTQRNACIREEKRLSVIGDARYAELNAAVRRLNAITKNEKR